MWTYHLLSHLAVLTLGVGVPVLIYRSLRASLEGTIEDLLGLPEATRFYVRTFATVVLVTGICGAARPLAIGGQDPKHPSPVHFMQYVTAVASSVEMIFHREELYLLFFATAVTILAALGSEKWNTKPY